MISWRTKLLIAAGVLFLLSLGINIWFLAGQGIHVHNTYHQDQRQFQYQNQQQASILLGVFAAEGTVRWERFDLSDLEVRGFGTEFDDAFPKFMASLAPEQSLFAKVIWERREVYVPSLSKPAAK